MTLTHHDRVAAKADRILRGELERAVNLLRKAEAIHDAADTLGVLDDPTREAMRKLRAKGRSVAIHASEQDRK